MFEQQIEKTISLISERTIGSAGSIKLQGLLDSNIIEPFKTFFTADVDEWLQEELHRLLESPHFDYSESSLRSTLEDLNARSKMHAVYRKDEFIQALERGTKLLFNYTCRPQWTQTKFIYDDANKVPVASIFRGLRYFSDYPYYATILDQYFSKRNLDEFPVAKFDELLHLIDQEVVKNFNSSQMAELSWPIFALFNLDVETHQAVVPLEALHIFYDDKGNSAIVERLEREREEKGNISVGMHDLKLFISDVEFAIGNEISELVNIHVGGEEFDSLFPSLEEVPEEEAAPEEEDFKKEEDIKEEEEFEPPVMVMPEAEKETTEIPEGGTAEGLEFSLSDIELTEETLPEPVSATDLEDLEQEFERSYGSAEAPESVPSEEPKRPMEIPQIGDIPSESSSHADRQADLSSPVPEEVKPEVQEKLDVQFQPIEEEIPATTVQEAPTKRQPPAEAPPEQINAVEKFGDLRTAISSRDRKKFVKKIFDRSEEKYNTAVDILNNKPTWKEASEFIDEIFLNNNVDMYSRIAVQFTDEIYKRYLARK